MFHMVSIHALLAECDRRGHLIPRAFRRFNPRTPCGVRLFSLPGKLPPSLFQSTHSLRSATRGFRGFKMFHMVSIHALLAECDPLDAPGRRVKVVSIHALLAECDMMMPLSPHQETSFNPRTPCGVRQSSGANGRDSTMFQSTHSLRSATLLLSGGLSPVDVSIHALLAECDLEAPPRR